MSQENLFIKLKSPPHIIEEGCTAAYLFTEGNCVFVEVTDNHYHLTAICQYDLERQMIRKLYDYPSKFDRGLVMSLCIDQKKHIIYMTGDHLLVILDLKKESWDLINEANQSVEFSNLHFIPSPINELHLTAKYHWKYDSREHQLLKSNNDTSIINDVVAQFPLV